MTDYLNNSNKNDINRVDEQYYTFLKNIYNKNNFEQHQDFNNLFNSINNNNNNEKNNEINKNNEESKILLQTQKELNELNKERCAVIKTDHSEDFKNINNSLCIKKIFYVFIFIIILYYFVKNV